MGIPQRVFKLRRYPHFGGYILVIFPSFFLLAFSGVILFSYLPDVIRWLAFPIMPVAMTLFIGTYLQPPCEVHTDGEGMNLITLRHSIGLTAGSLYRKWADFTQFKFYSNKGIFLRLYFGQEEIVFSGDGARVFYTFLVLYFPEREKKGFWG